MATYRKVSRLVPSIERSAVITDIVAGDEIDIKDILGRSARRIKIVVGAGMTSVSLRLNNKIRMEKHRDIGINAESYDGPSFVEVVSEGAHHPVYTLAGGAEYYTEEGMAISFVQIDAAVVASGSADVTIYAW